MNSFFATTLAALFAVNLAYAQAPAAPVRLRLAGQGWGHLLRRRHNLQCLPRWRPLQAHLPHPIAKPAAVGKNGKPLSGAAKTSFIKKCEGGTKASPSNCEAKAVDKNGKPLAGAAKSSFLKKCEADAARESYRLC